MKTMSKQASKGAVPVGKQRSYTELVEFLNANWSKAEDKHVSCVKQLDAALGSIAKKLNTVFVAGHNGKSLTVNFAAQLLEDEGLKVGSFYTPHMLTYNERFCINNESISNNEFVDIMNNVINTAEQEELVADSLDILTMAALVYFHKNNVDVAVCEINEQDPLYVSGICSPKIAAITRIALHPQPASEENKQALRNILATVQKDTHVVSADQSKMNLQTMIELTEERGGVWAMPIRKLVTLEPPFEQLHGRCAALAERICDILINNFTPAEKIKPESLLAKQKGQRGRPTLEAKRQSELNPKRTIEHFWSERANTLACRFQLFDKEKPTVLLDNANNMDAFDNLLLGIRLLHYKRPLKGLSLIIGCNNPDLENGEFLKLLRYFFKKTSGNIVLCPVKPVEGDKFTVCFNAEKVTNDIKSMKIKARAAKNFKDAFEIAQSSVDERQGLIVVAGSASLLTEFYELKGTKKA